MNKIPMLYNQKFIGQAREGTQHFYIGTELTPPPEGVVPLMDQVYEIADTHDIDYDQPYRLATILMKENPGLTKYVALKVVNACWIHGAVRRIEKRERQLDSMGKSAPDIGDKIRALGKATEQTLTSGKLRGAIVDKKDVKVDVGIKQYKMEEIDTDEDLKKCAANLMGKSIAAYQPEDEPDDQ